MSIDAAGHLNVTGSVTKVYLRVQRCIKGQPGVPDPANAAKDYDGPVPPTPPGPLGYALSCTPTDAGLTLIFDPQYSYIVQFLVDVDYSPMGPVLPKVEISPDAVASP